MKQLSKILTAFIHCKTIVLSEIKIIDPESSLKILPKLCCNTYYLYVMSDWDAKLLEKVLKFISQNEGLKKTCKVDIPTKNLGEEKMMKLAKEYQENII